MTYSGVRLGLELLEWFIGRQLQRPPLELGNELCVMAFSILTFLQESLTGVRDLRVIFIRGVALVRAFLEGYDRSVLEDFKVFSGTVVNIQRNCAFCEARLPSDMTADQMEEQDAQEHEPCYDPDEVDIQEESRPTFCGVCRELRYCTMGCQVADSRRHRRYCIRPGEPFYSEEVKKIFLPM